MNDPHHPDIAGFEARFASPDEVVIFKPAGVASQLSDDRRGASALERVRAAGFPHAELPHRLDRPTSGLLLIAFSKEAVAHHNARIRAHEWRKCYIGKIPNNPGQDAEILGKHRLHLRREGMVTRVVRSGGDPAETTVHALAPDPVDRRARQALIEIHTGRFHQIRATLSHLGAPLLGDGRYGGAGPQRAFFLEHSALRFAPCAAERAVWVFSRDRRDRRSPIAPELTGRLRALAEA